MSYLDHAQHTIHTVHRRRGNSQILALLHGCLLTHFCQPSIADARLLHMCAMQKHATTSQVSYHGLFAELTEAISNLPAGGQTLISNHAYMLATGQHVASKQDRKRQTTFGTRFSPLSAQVSSQALQAQGYLGRLQTQDWRSCIDSSQAFVKYSTISAIAIRQS